MSKMVSGSYPLSSFGAESTDIKIARTVIHSDSDGVSSSVQLPVCGPSCILFRGDAVASCILDSSRQARVYPTCLLQGAILDLRSVTSRPSLWHRFKTRFGHFRSFAAWICGQVCPRRFFKHRLWLSQCVARFNSATYIISKRFYRSE